MKDEDFAYEQLRQKRIDNMKTNEIKTWPGCNTKLVSADNYITKLEQQLDRSAQRIAACVNACIGIPTERLKKIAAHGSIVDSEICGESAVDSVDTKLPEARAKVFDAIGTERYYQETKWGDLVDHPQSVGAYLTLMRVHLARAENAWAGANNDLEALNCLRKVLAIGVACGEQHGMPRRHDAEPTLRANPFSDDEHE